MPNNWPPLEAIYFRDFKNAYIPDILEEIYLRKIYEPYLLGKKDLTIVDVGQNIGLFSYYASPYAKRVIGLEPSQMHRDTTTQMLKFNKIKNVEILPYGLSNTNETKKFYLSGNTTAYSLTQLDPNAPIEEIEVITVKKLFELAKIDKIDLMKLDCEGEESKVINSPEFKELSSKIPLVVGEHHSWDSQNQYMFANSFVELGYEFHWLPNMKAQVFTAVRL